jgi:hypothetical protein
MGIGRGTLHSLLVQTAHASSEATLKSATSPLHQALLWTGLLTVFMAMNAELLEMVGLFLGAILRAFTWVLSPIFPEIYKARQANREQRKLTKKEQWFVLLSLSAFVFFLIYGLQTFGPASRR